MNEQEIEDLFVVKKEIGQGSFSIMHYIDNVVRHDLQCVRQGPEAKSGAKG